jgi:HKD family nuclease
MSSIQILSNINYPIGNIINQELQNSRNTQVAVAFLKHTGIKVIENSLKLSLDKGGYFEIIAGLDFKTTDPKAMQFFITLKKKYKNVNFFCYGDKLKNRTDIVFHPKIYLFDNGKETTSIVGSTNLTGGGLQTNFEVNTIFKEKKPIYFSQLQAIYNSIKFTDTLFTPDEEYLNGYSNVFNAFEANEDKALKDKGIVKTIKEITKREETLPGTIPSIKLMIVDFIKRKNEEGQKNVSISEIYEELEKVISEKNWSYKYKLYTFRNTIRGEINHNEASNTSKNSLRLFKRENRGYYSLTRNGKNYKGR